MWDKLDEIEKHFGELESQIGLPEVVADPKKLQQLLSHPAFPGSQPEFQLPG